MFQTWVRERGGGVYRLDIFREPHDGATWICRRDQSIRLPYDQIIVTSPEGVPYLVPEIVLLFKARHKRPKDQADFAGVLPLLSPARRAWLVAALERLYPGHSWTTDLRRSLGPGRHARWGQFCHYRPTDPAARLAVSDSRQPSMADQPYRRVGKCPHSPGE